MLDGQPTAAEPDRKRSRVADMNAVQEKRRTAVTTPSDLASQRSVRPHAAPATPVTRDARAVVLGNAGVLQHIMAMLAGPSREARADVGHMGSVWQAVAGHLTPQLRVEERRHGSIPVLSLQDGVEDDGGVVCWEHVRRIGGGLVVRDVWGQHDWEERLTVHFEMWDEMDGLRMLSTSGRLRLLWHPEGSSISIGRAGSEIVGPGFSASSRESLGRLGSIREYSQRAHLLEYPTSLRVRVDVTEEGVYTSPASGQAADVHDSARLWTVAPTPVDEFSRARIVFQASNDETQAFILSALA